MNAVFVESSNNYLAKSSHDDMMWTPSLDKRIYKLLTYVYGGICVCSNSTYSLLPDKMKQDKNRTFIVAQRRGDNTLIKLNKKYPNAVLVGGPSFLKQAYDLGIVHNFVITTVKTEITSSKEFLNPFVDELTKMQHKCKIDFGDIVINMYQKTK